MNSNPRLKALATAVPPYELQQPEVAKRVAYLFEGHPEVIRLLPVFGNAGIVRRYSCVPVEWYADAHCWRDRTAVYRQCATDLLEKVTGQLLASARLSPDDLDAVVTVSTTGVLTPSLDALLIERLALRRDIKRLPIFGLGCAGGVTGLARAADLARAMPRRNVLFLVVELCALNFRKDDCSKSNIVATALFGDGAAGALISTNGDGPMLVADGQYTWPDSLDVMGWDIEDDGMRALFATSIPGLIRRDIRSITADFLRRSDLARSDIDLFACHPGGAKVLEALEEALELGTDALADSRAVLRDYGNMSAATVLFALDRMEWRAAHLRILMSALGPGFSAAFQLVESP